MKRIIVMNRLLYFHCVQLEFNKPPVQFYPSRTGSTTLPSSGKCLDANTSLERMLLSIAQGRQSTWSEPPRRCSAVTARPKILYNVIWTSPRFGKCAWRFCGSNGTKYRPTNIDMSPSWASRLALAEDNKIQYTIGQLAKKIDCIPALCVLLRTWLRNKQNKVKFSDLGDIFGIGLPVSILKPSEGRCTALWQKVCKIAQNYPKTTAAWLVIWFQLPIKIENSPRRLKSLAPQFQKWQQHGWWVARFHRKFSRVIPNHKLPFLEPRWVNVLSSRDTWGRLVDMRGSSPKHNGGSVPN